VDTSDKVDIHVLILILSYIYIAGGRQTSYWTKCRTSNANRYAKYEKRHF